MNDNKEVSKRTLATLRKVQQMGVRIMLASGRPTYGLLGLAKMLELDTYNGYVMAYNGGQVIRAADGEVIFERRINPELIPYLEKKADKTDLASLLIMRTVLLRTCLTIRTSRPKPSSTA